jgi:riboflavin synthase
LVLFFKKELLSFLDVFLMFTGIITARGEIRSVTRGGDGTDMRAVIGVPAPFIAGAEIGASIACSGCCLTVTELALESFAVDVSGETVSRTTLGHWRHGTRINLERSLRLGDEMGGHIVSGHVDGIGHIVEISPEGGSLRMTVAVPTPLHRYIAAKGSVAIDGISLTVNEVGRGADGAEVFGVNIIPHTADNTTLGLRGPGDAVHIEIDMLARYVARLTETA